MSARRVRDIARGVGVLVPLGAAGVGLAAPWSVLVGGLGWLIFLLASLSGWGTLVEKLARQRVDPGMRWAWGTAAILGAAGPLLAAGVLTRVALAGLLGIGALAFAIDQARTPRPWPLYLGDGIAAWRRDPAVTVLWAALAAIAIVNVADACVLQRMNVYDDDVAYTPLVKRLVEVGNLDEPFSFRRISAYGGQTVLSALAAVRGTLANPYLIDHGLFHLMTLALVLGLARRHAADRLVTGLVILVLELLPDTSINTASYWSGLALFLALYRTVADAPPDTRRLAVAAAVAAGLCTLRQNYIPVVALFLALVLLVRLSRPLTAAWRRDRRAWLAVTVTAIAGVAPYAIASWRSNQTLLYPLQLGTFNPTIELRPIAWTAWQELQFFARVALESDPLRVLVPLAPALLLCRDERRWRPFLAFAVACALGFVLLVHSFTLSDPPNLWRYGFGFMTAAAIVFVVETTADGLSPASEPPPPRLSLPTTARALVVGCLIAQLASTTKPVMRRYSTVGARLAAGARTHTRAEIERAAPTLYRDAQAAVPRGARLAVLLDQPAYLDYARNPIINLDIPGYSSYRPGMPFFRGAEPVAAYFRDHGVHHLAFVRGDHSRYFYRREFWVSRIMWDTELWQVMGAYVVDCLDNFAALAARYPVLFERDGVVVLDLHEAR